MIYAFNITDGLFDHELIDYYSLRSMESFIEQKKILLLSIIE